MAGVRSESGIWPVAISPPDWASLLLSFQCYLYLVYSPARTTKVVLMLFFICLGNGYLHGLRNLWQILFHVGVASLSSHQILTRQLQEKPADCGV